MMCDYTLDGLSENRCPECGHAFNPDDPNTFLSSDFAVPIWGLITALVFGLLLLLFTILMVIYGK